MRMVSKNYWTRAVGISTSRRVFNRPCQPNVVFLVFYYPPEVSRVKYWGLGVLIKLGSKNKKHLKGSTQATIHPLAIILTATVWALVSITA